MWKPAGQVKSIPYARVEFVAFIDRYVAYRDSMKKRCQIIERVTNSSMILASFE